MHYLVTIDTVEKRLCVVLEMIVDQERRDWVMTLENHILFANKDTPFKSVTRGEVII